MDIEKFREYCLSFEGATEKTPFGKFAARFSSILVFYVCNHIFCMIDMDDFRHVVVRNNPEKISELYEAYEYTQRPRNMSPKYWIQLNLGGDISDAEVLRLVQESYAIVRAKYTRKSR